MDTKRINNILAETGYAVYNSNLSELKDNITVAKNDIIIFCNVGSAIIEINMLEYAVSAGSCILIHTGSIIKLHSASPDFNTLSMLANEEAVLASSIGIETEIFNVLYKEPCFRIDNPKEISLLNNCLENLRIFSELPKPPHHAEFVHGTIRNIYIILYSSRYQNVDIGKSATMYSSADNYFREFLRLIRENCSSHHDVTFYAEKLHITPKYLNEISRKKAHVTAKEIITKFLVAQIKRELLISGNSVQRIAYDYNFCDQSSLGKFFKKATGMSPIAFRRSQ